MATITWLLGLLKLEDARGPRPIQHFDFLALPGEIRNKIYLLTLTTDPPVLDRQHKHDCSWCMWEQRGCQNSIEVYSSQIWPGCNCRVREGLAILLANRQIHDEAAPIFWGGNHLSFRGFETFIHLVGTVLRPQYRQMIPHITIYSNPRGGPRNPPVPPMRLWSVLFQCKGLHTLELPSYRRLLPNFTGMRLLVAEGTSWNRLTSELPNLKMLSWSFFIHCFEEVPWSDVPHPCESEYRTRISKCLDLKIWSPEQLKLYGPLDWDDIHFGDFLRRRPAPRGPQDLVYRRGLLVSTGRPNEYRRAAAVVLGQNTFDVTHPEAIPTTWIVKNFVVPLIHSRPGDVIESFQ